MKVYAPGKLILSGEHAVVYGHPAIAMAINRYAEASITRSVLPQILLDLSDLAHRRRISFEGLRLLKQKVKRKYLRFTQGDFSIRDVLQKPFELAHVVLGLFAEAFDLPLPEGIKIQLQSDIPMGCGMGSSAASILSVLYAISTYMQIPIDEETLFKLALEAENLQHGYSSGLDLRISLKGGCLYVENNLIETRLIPTMPMYLVNTGSPKTTTGQCVEKAAIHFKNTSIGEDFAAVTRSMDAALQARNWSGVHQAMNANQALLATIGVVPLKVQAFIAKVKSLGGAAKICGAGAVGGEQAGAVLVAMEDDTLITELCHYYHYNVMPIQGESRGVYAI